MKKYSVLKEAFVRLASILLTFLLSILCINLVFSQVGSSESGWHLTNYTFKDGSISKETVLMGTTSKMKDVISYKGDKGHIEISQNRYGVPKGEHIAGVTYKVSWTDPPAVLLPGEKHFVDFELKTTASKTWKAGQQSIYLNQGLNGVYFITPEGAKYITKDIKTRLTTEKVIEKGTKGAKRIIQMNFGNGFVATYDYEWREGKSSEKPAVIVNNKANGWHLNNYTFKDGSLSKETVLMGTTSKMKDVISYKGDKGHIEISQNRYGVPKGEHIAGVTYKVSWTDPPAVLIPGEKHFVDFELKTTASKTWKAGQQSIYLNQGLNGVYFITPEGAKYITKDIKTRLTTEKVIEKGTKGAKRIIQMNFGNGFVATYDYEWRE